MVLAVVRCVYICGCVGVCVGGACRRNVASDNRRVAGQCVSKVYPQNSAKTHSVGLDVF